MGKKSKRRKAKTTPPAVTPVPPPAPPPKPLCQNCQLQVTSTDLPMTCSRCKSAVYCSKQCQEADWKRHRKACKGLAQERSMIQDIRKMNKEYMRDPEKKEMIERLKEMGKQDRSESSPFDSDKIQFRMKGMVAAMNAKEELDVIKERYQDYEPVEEAKKLINILAANHDRSALQSELLFHLHEKQRTWEACFSSKEMKAAFFELLRDIMKGDIENLNNLPPGADEDDISVAPASFFVIDRVSFGRPLGPPDDFGMVSYELHEERAEEYFSTCWPEHLQLSLATWGVMKNDKRKFDNLHLLSASREKFLQHSFRLERLIAHCWRTTCMLAQSKRVARAILTEPIDGKPIHDTTSPRLAFLIRLLALQGKGIHKFKHYIYLVTALLLLHAKSMHDESFVSAVDVVLNVLDEGMSENGRHFFHSIALSFAQRILAGESNLQYFDRVLEASPECKGLL